MNACMYVCMYVCMCVYIYVCTYVCMYVCTLCLYRDVVSAYVCILYSDSIEYDDEVAATGSNMGSPRGNVYRLVS